ncbi:MAG: hypothetical protein K8R38_06740 [Verrucomicrobia bacterium]|nr:hypothetical protein [Verrucomicrobiota bacterium]
MKQPPPSTPHLQKERGASLILTLCMIVLVTVVAVAFFSRSATNSTIENVRAGQIFSAQISESGAARAYSGFLAQISSESNSMPVTNAAGLVCYLPISATNMLPACTLAQPAMQTDDNFANLIRQSVPSADPMASTDNSATASRNGLMVNAARWNAPALVPGGFSLNNQLPCWVYINKDGSLTNAVSSNAIGRFAYNAYDTGGLLDANVAGYPSSVSAADRTFLKGTLAGADLTLLPGVTQAAVNDLVAFRNPQATNSAGYRDYVTGAAGVGFLSSEVTNGSGIGVTTNNYFYSRQDLIRYVRTQNTPLTNALPYLTHFTRELARPSLNTNGLLNMTNRFDLSQLTNATLSPTVLANLSNALFSSIPALTNTSDTNVYMGPTNFFAAANWVTNVGVKIAAISANICAQASTNEVSISTPYGVVVGKKARPEVAQLVIQTVTRVNSYKNPWYEVNIDLYVAPVVWSPAGGSGTYYLKTSFSNNGGLLSIDPPNQLTNVPSTFSGNTNIALTSYLTPTAYPVQMTSIGARLQKNHAQNIYNSVGEIALGVSTNSAGSNCFSAFGTNKVISSPISGIILNPTVQNPVLTPADANSTTTNQFVVNVLDPRTIRGAGLSTTNGTNLPAWASCPPYPNSVTDTNPVILERSYASVGELGVVFRDQPWRSLDFVSGPASADRNLLDLFSAYPTPANGMRAGVLNLNTPHSLVLASLLAGTVTSGSGTISPTTATTYASNMVAATSVTPLTNRSQLIDLVSSNIIATSGDVAKQSREAAIRTLAEPGQTRTWNLLLDVVAQTGRATASPASAENFTVQGERRIWVNVAVDRLTGRIVDCQTEEVNE